MVGVKRFDEKAALTAALDVFWRQGLAGTSMPDLAEATGVQRGSLYNAYGDKEAVFLRAFDIYEKRFLQLVEGSLVGTSAEAILLSFFHTVIENMFSGKPSRGCLTTKTAVDGSVASVRIQVRLQVLIERLEMRLESAFRRPEVENQLHLAPNEAAELVVTFTRGLAVMERITADKERLLRTSRALVASLTKHA